jgi:hypothetical protein
VPREANKVCRNKYGDCKDMASITSTMMNLAGLEANLTWIGTRNISYTYEQVPSPITDNHMIASALVDGQRLFFDDTGLYLKYGFPTSMVQGKQALIGKANGEHELAMVPVMTAEQNKKIEISEIRYEDERIVGTGATTLSGYRKFNVVQRLETVKEARLEQFVNGLLRRGNNKFAVEQFEISGEKDRDQNLEMTYKFAINDYLKKVGEEIYINLNLNKRLQNSSIDIEKKKLPIERDFLNTASHLVRFEIPEGYEVNYLPENTSYENDLFSFDIQYSQDQNKVTLQKEITINHLILKKEQFEKWNEMIELLDDAYKESVVLKASN